MKGAEKTNKMIFYFELIKNILNVKHFRLDEEVMINLIFNNKLKEMIKRKANELLQTCKV